MKVLLFGLLILNIFLVDNPPASIINFKDNNHLILIFSSDNKSTKYEQALIELARDPLGLDTRDLIIFEIFQRGGILPDGSSLSESEVNELRSYYAIDPNQFILLIVNKNLTEVFRSDVPVPPQKIFDAIDQSGN